MEEKGFRKLRVWQEAHEFVKMIYKATEKFPKAELFGLTPQIRRAVISIPANIVEGYAYRSNRFLSEGEYQELEGQQRKVGAYLTKFIKAIKKTN